MPCVVLFCLIAVCHTAVAQVPAPPDMDADDAAEKRFPQPVVVGTLLGSTVLQPLESQPILGHVERIVRQGNSGVQVVMSYGGFLGFGTRQIAVPVEAMALLGRYMEVIDYTPEQLASFPTFNEVGTTSLANDAVIKVGLARPSH